MYVLNRHKFAVADIRGLEKFVVCWERFYRDNVQLPNSDIPINYLDELNLHGDLSKQNIIRLLRWKDPRFLTHPKQPKTGRIEPNSRVRQVLDRISVINRFRNGKITKKDFSKVTEDLFPSGSIIMPLFLFHVARPWEWPIADQHVFRAYSKLFKKPVPTSIESFDMYIRQFNELASQLRNSTGVRVSDRKEVCASNKRLDSALMAYGQFLGEYDR